MIIEKLTTLLGFELEPGSRAQAAAYDASVASLKKNVAGLGPALARASARWKQYAVAADAVIGGFKKLSVMAGLGGAAVLGFAVKSNMATEANWRLARSFKLPLDYFEAFQDSAKLAGLDANVMTGALRKLSVQAGKLGAAKPPKALTDALQTLGLDAKEFRGQDLQNQFISIMTAAQRAGGSQQALAASQALLGGQGAILAGAAANNAEAFDQMIERLITYDMKTEEAIDGAVSFASNARILGSVLGSLWDTISGMVGGAMVPLLINLREWILDNKELIRSNIVEFARGFAGAMSIVERVFRGLLRHMDKIVPLIKILAFVLGGALMTKGISTILDLAAAWKLAGNRALWAQAKMFLIPLAIAAIGLAIEDIYGFLHGKKSVFGLLLAKLEKWMGIDIAEPFRRAFEEGIPETFRQLGVEIKSIWRDIVEYINESITGLVKRIPGVGGWIVDKLGWGKYDAQGRRDKIAASRELDKNIKLLTGQAVFPASGETSWQTGNTSLASYYTAPSAPQMTTARGAQGIARVDVGGITVNASPKHDEKKIAKHVKRELEKGLNVTVGNAMRTLSTGVSY